MTKEIEKNEKIEKEKIIEKSTINNVKDESVETSDSKKDSGMTVKDMEKETVIKVRDILNTVKSDDNTINISGLIAVIQSARILVSDVAKNNDTIDIVKLASAFDKAGEQVAQKIIKQSIRK